MNPAGSALIVPDKPGLWRVQHQNGEWYPAKVRQTEDGFLAKIPACSSRWHFIEWLSMNGWMWWLPDMPNKQAEPSARRNETR
jgi:hypothetical protein